MAKRPSLQFYPADWAGNANLKRCTFEEKGIWVDVMCLMHDQPEYGVLRWPLDEIAEAVKCKPTSLRAIARKNVIKGSDTAIEDFIYVPRSGRKDGDPVILIPAQDGPIWYSSRMVTDEYVRNHAGASTRFGARQSKESPNTMPADGDSPSRSPSHRHGDTKPRQGERRGEYQGDGSSSSSSSSSSSGSLNPDISSQFDTDQARGTIPRADVAVKSKAAKGPERGTRVPEPFEITEDMRAWAQANSPNVDVKAATAEFVDYWRGVPGTKGRKLDWIGTWRNRMRECEGRARRNGNGRASPPAKPGAPMTHAQVMADLDRVTDPNSEEWPS